MTTPKEVRVPISADVLAYIQQYNEGGEKYGRTAARILTAAMRAGIKPVPFTPVKHDDLWTPEEDALILQQDTEGDTWPNGKPRYTFTIPELMEQTGRSPAAIKKRRSRLLDPRWTPPVSHADVPGADDA